MKTVDLANEEFSRVEDLLAQAVSESILVRNASGESFVISHADDLETEVELLRRNHDFLSLLDEMKADRSRISISDIERELR
ncbi:MAG: hypothetical protein KC964_04055 [Candidatus Omnitrophica bacterium]|nr:hypothetical protein [Candidatus Omnitrophota bacterium]